LTLNFSLATLLLRLRSGRRWFFFRLLCLGSEFLSSFFYALMMVFTLMTSEVNKVGSVQVLRLLRHGDLFFSIKSTFVIQRQVTLGDDILEKLSSSVKFCLI